VNLVEIRNILKSCFDKAQICTSPNSHRNSSDPKAVFL